MKKFLVYPLECALVIVLGLLIATPREMFAQDHVVSPSQLQRDLAAEAAVRQHNREQLERFLSSEEARKAMKASHINYRQVGNAIGQLSDSDLAMLAARSAQAQKDFAAGTIGNHDLLIILVGIAALILIIVAVR